MSRQDTASSDVHVHHDPPPDAVRAQLSRVVGSRTFEHAPVLRRFLVHVVEGVLDGRTDQLKEYALGVDVFDRGDSFDPRQDTIVRVQARRLRAKLAEYHRADGSGDPVVIEMPVGTYVPAFRWRALPHSQRRPALVVELPPPAAAGTLPVPRTPLLGREQDLADVKQLLLRDDVRLVTLTGAGGSGKTRLAIEAAAELADEFPGGVCFVPLASVASPEEALAAIAQRLGVRHTGGRTIGEAMQGYVTHAVRARTLLFLDNFEHVLEAAPLLGRVLEASGALRMLVTSRAALRVAGEHEYSVPPLPVPAAGEIESLDALARNPAVALFLHRARAVKPDFALTSQNAVALVRVCARVDGLPLAIELAAARVKLFPPEAMLSRLDTRLGFLMAGPRDLPARQRTLRTTIDWSHALLGPAEQQLFRRLAVFRGGFTLEAVEAVCNTRRDLGLEVVDGVASLLDQCLIQPVAQDGAEARFSMLETIREYALERLTGSSDAPDTCRSHAAYCLVLAEEGNVRLTDDRREAWLARCDFEHDNFRAALDWLIEQDHGEWGLRLVLALFGFWERREHLGEGLARTNAVLAMPGAAARTWRRARATMYAATFLTCQGDYETSLRITEPEALDIFRELGDDRGVAMVLNAMGSNANLLNDWTAARAYYEQAVAACRALGDRSTTAGTLSNLADVVSAQGDHALARTLLEEALSLFRELEDWRGIGWSLNHLGDAARDRGDLDEAGRMYQQGAETFRAQGDAWGASRSLADLAALASERGDYARASALFREALAILSRLGHRRGIARVLEGMAALAARQGHARRAFRLAGAAEALRRAIGAPQRPRDKASLDGVLAMLACDGDARAAFREAGARMPLADAVRYGLEDETGHSE